jgi:SAM-dependent methyltransferase
MNPAQQPNDASYEQIGLGYPRARRTEPRIAARIFAALGDAQRVLNVGAGTGSYEPPGRDVLAVEPSRVMRSQRPPGAAPCIDARAEALPFPDQSFDAAMAVLSDHHWPDPIAGLREPTSAALSERAWLVAAHRGRSCLDRDTGPVWKGRADLPPSTGHGSMKPCVT